MMRIVFVDDEIDVLEATRRAMHTMRNEWNMEFVLNGDAALDSLARHRGAFERSPDSLTSTSHTHTELAL